MNGINDNPNDISAVINNDLELQAHELRNSFFNEPQVNTNVNFRNLYDPTMAHHQLANMTPAWSAEFQASQHEYGLILK